MVDIAKINSIIKNGDKTKIRKEINVVLPIITSCMTLITKSFNTLDANKFHFSQKLIKIADKCRKISMSGTADRFEQFATDFETKCPIRIKRLEQEYKYFVAPQYKQLERNKLMLEELLKTI